MGRYAPFSCPGSPRVSLHGASIQLPSQLVVLSAGNEGFLGGGEIAHRSFLVQMECCELVRFDAVLDGREAGTGQLPQCC